MRVGDSWRQDLSAACSYDSFLLLFPVTRKGYAASSSATTGCRLMYIHYSSIADHKNNTDIPFCAIRILYGMCRNTIQATWTFPDLGIYFWTSGPRRILRESELSVHTVSSICKYKAVQFYCCAVHCGIYILFIHQQMHFLLNLEKFKFTLKCT